MWDLYDTLTSDIPSDGVVNSAVITPIWTVSSTSFGAGLAMTPPISYKPSSLRGKIQGKTTGEIIKYLKSWDQYESAVALSVMNSYYNQTARIPKIPEILIRDAQDRPGVFGGFDELLKGKKVTMIGHGPYVDYLPAICNFTCLERLPSQGDLPDPACEYILPEQDFVFITATALENKTMPRLLELSKNAFTAIWGPSTTLTEKYFAYGADALIGQIVVSHRDVLRIAGEGGLSRDMSEYTKSVMWFRDTSMAEYIRNR